MNTKKMGLFAAAALSVLAAQANANPPAGHEAHADKDKMVCANNCGKDSGAGCGGKVFFKGIKDDKACAAKGGKWTQKTAEMTEKAAPAKAK